MRGRGPSPFHDAPKSSRLERGGDPFFPPRLRQFSALAMSPSWSVAPRLCGEMGTPHPIKPALGSLRSSEKLTATWHTRVFQQSPKARSRCLPSRQLGGWRDAVEGRALCRRDSSNSPGYRLAGAGGPVAGSRAKERACVPGLGPRRVEQALERGNCLVEGFPDGIHRRARPASVSQFEGND